jgi:hypothetical protein
MRSEVNKGKRKKKARGTRVTGKRSGAESEREKETSDRPMTVDEKKKN